MFCPFCRHADSRVIDSRTSDDGSAIRRRRQCPECQKRFTTVETAVLAVVKRSGVTEPFSREKVVSGVRRACQGRQVDDDALNLLTGRGRDFGDALTSHDDVAMVSFTGGARVGDLLSAVEAAPPAHCATFS